MLGQKEGKRGKKKKERNEGKCDCKIHSEMFLLIFNLVNGKKMLVLVIKSQLMGR